MRDTIEMAREAGLLTWLKPPEDVIERFKTFEALVRADERERLYGKDIDTLLFEEHRLGFEKGSRSERKACAKVCDDLSLSQNSEWEVGTLDCAEAIRARGDAK
jgi:hypothetical protein